MTQRRIWLIADDYALSPGVSEAILDLMKQRRISGTGCMTLFPEWSEAAARLRDVPLDRAIGLHLTLTDQIALSGQSALAPDGRLPSLGRLLLMTATSKQAASAAIHELDLQYRRFVDVMGRTPDFVDGHQHIHFLRVARRWLAGLAADNAPLFVRGAPALSHAPRAVLAKAGIVRGMARGFDRAMRASGLGIVGPLAGFYYWDDRTAFATAVENGIATLPDNALFMCHPGRVDSTLESRDRLRAPRAVEFDYLRSPAFTETLERHGASIAALER